MKTRVEHDSMGDIEVRGDRYWGAQTQRSFENFQIHDEKIPMDVIYAFAHLKMACAKANQSLKKLDDRKADVIISVCEEILGKQLDAHFPLSVWQTGSGTQSNMNCNEVIANRGNEIVKEKLLHPNDDVNKSQSSNDTFPTAMHIAATLGIRKALLRELDETICVLKRLEKENEHIIKIGRTHLQDATPLRFSQEISGWRSMLENNRDMLVVACETIQKLAIGGTAVGTGLNAPKGFDDLVCDSLSKQLDVPFRPDPNKFHALTSKDDLVFVHGACKALAANLMKIANDVRFLASGPRCGFGEIRIPENEPGSSIMPGKVNPTQCESMTMVCVQVFGNDATIGFAASQGNFELNVFMPVIIHNMMQTIHLLSDGMRSFRIHCLSGIQANEDQMHTYLHHSLMLVTALNPYIGYENAAKCAKKAFQDQTSLKQACMELGFLSEEEFDRYVDPKRMVTQQ